VLAATDHAMTPEREAEWQEIQRRTAALSPQGRVEVVRSGHFIQEDAPDAVVAGVLSVARAAGLATGACR
jgi:pimeloyl-ACP methyl ester carboxylesterase